MPDFEVGEAWVSLQPSGKSFGQKAKKELADVDLSKSVDLDLDRSKLEAAIKQVKAELAALDRERVNPSIQFDIAVAEARIQELTAKLDELTSKEATPKVAVAIAEAERDLASVTRKLDDLNGRKASVDIDAQTAAAQAQLDTFQAKLDEVDRLRAQPQVTADVTDARARLDEVNAQLTRLSGMKADPEVELQIARARQDALTISAELERLSAMRPSVQVDADTASASAKLAVLNEELSRINGRRVKVDADASGLSTAVGMTGLVATGLGAIAAAAPAAAAGLAAVAGAGAALGQGVGAAILGFSGISDAVKAVESDEKTAATSSAASSKTRASGANQVANAQASLQQAQVQADRAAITGAQQVAEAQQSLTQARTSQARTAVQGAQQVADAERSLAQAVTNAGRQRITSDQQVTAARRAVSDAITTANQRVSSSEASLASAQRSRQYAQEALTRATAAAVAANNDLFYSLNDAALAERRAQLNLKKAVAEFNAGAGDPEELQLNVDEAAGALDEVRYNYGKLQAEQAQYAKTGVAGTDQVVAATRSLQDAQRGVQDAQQGVTQAQVQGARAVQDAQVALAQTAQQAGWQQADAAAAVADAQTGVQRAAVAAGQANADAATQVAQAQAGVQKAVQQAAWSQADAAKGVQDAQRALAQAYTSTGAAGAAGGKQAAYALSKLSPAGREFVDFLTKEWKPAWENTSHAIADRMLPGVEAGMRSLLSLQPELTAGLADTGGIIGDLAERGGQLAASGPFRADFVSIMSSNNRSLASMGDAGLHLFGALTDIYTVAGPVIERFTRLADWSAQAFESWIIGERASGQLGQSLQSAGDTLMWVGGIIVDVGGDVVTLAGNLAPLGAAALETVRYVSDLVAGLSNLAGPVGTSIVVGLGLGTLAVSKLGTAMKGLEVAGGATGLKSFANVISTVFVPSNLAATSGMQKFGSVAETAAGKVGAGEEAASKFGSRMNAIGSSLPLIGAAVIGAGIAFDALVTSTDEASAAMFKGGQASQDMVSSLGWQTTYIDGMRATLGDWAADLVGKVVPGIHEVNQAVGQQLSQMSSLQFAQTLATAAQGDYDAAVRQFGPNSVQAAAAQKTLATDTIAVKEAQEAARTATMNATQALQDQQDQVLGSINSRIGLEQATRRVADAQDRYRDAVAQSGAGSSAAKDAELELEQAQTNQAAAARKAAEDEAKKKGVVDTSAQSNLAYAQSVGQMVGATQGQLSPALTQMIQSLDWAGLSAAGAQVKINDAGQAVATFPNGKTVVLDANTSPAVGQITFVKGLVDSTKGTIGVDADPGPGIAKVGGFKLQTDATTGTVTIAGNISPADQARLGIQAKTDGTTGVMWINGNPVPCDGKLNGMRVRVDGTTGVMSIDANKDKAQDKSDRVHGSASAPVNFGVDANTQPAEGTLSRFFTKTVPDMVSHVFGRAGMNEVRAAFGMAPLAQGGLVGDAKLVPAFAGGGKVRGPGGPTSDRIPAMLSAGEYVVRAAAVQNIGVPALDRINAAGHASGGPIGLAAGGTPTKQPPAASAAGPAAMPAAAAGEVAVPAGDPTAAAATAGATDALTSSMAAAATQAGVLAPALTSLATTQSGLLVPATAMVTAGQQAMVTTGILPLVGSLLSTLFPTLEVYQQQVGVAAPLANTELQTAQLGTQLSTSATALNTAVNTAAMNAAVTGMALTGQVQHDALQGAQFATQLSTNATALNNSINNTGMVASTTGMSIASQNQLLLLRYGHDQTQASTVALAMNNAGQNNAIISSTAFMSGQSQFHLGALRGAQGATVGSTIAFADAWRDQMGRTVPDSANPIRWILLFPMRSIVDAWNNLDGQFALNKHVNPVLPGFAAGGSISGPGTGTSDSIPALLSDGEFVIREKIASRTMPFLQAFNAGQPEAVRAAGGFGANPHGLAGKFADGGPVVERINAAKQFAASMNGKPYIWGGTGPAGMDCSGYVGAVTHVLRGESPFAGRLGVAASQPWPGFRPGLGGAWATGYNATHTAGTLAGTNIESGATPIRYPGAEGADAPIFTGHAFLPQIGGAFVSGGAGGGMIDVGPIVDKAFEKAYQEIADIPRFWGPSAQVGRGQGTARYSADAVKQKATAQLTEMFSSMGGGNVESYRGVVMQALTMMGQPPNQADTVLRRMGQESGGNPTIVNRSDINWQNGTPSVGLMQVIGPTYASNKDPRADVGPYLYGVSTNPLSNILASMHYTLGRYGSLPAGYNRAGGYDNGGVLHPGLTMAYNGTGAREMVLDNVETKNYDTLGRLMGSSGLKVDAPDSSSDAGGPRPMTASLYDVDGALIGTMRGIARDAVDGEAVALLDGRRF